MATRSLVRQLTRGSKRISPSSIFNTTTKSITINSSASFNNSTLNSFNSSNSIRSFSSTKPTFAETQPRGDYKKLTSEDVEIFRSFLSTPNSSCITTIESTNGSYTASTKEDLIAYNNDWMDKYFGNSTLLLKPKSTEEVSKIMKYCYEQRIAVVPQGGNTGLVGGSTPVYDEVILSTEGMKEIREFDEVSGKLYFLFASFIPRRLSLSSDSRYHNSRWRSHFRSYVKFLTPKRIHDATRSRS